MDEPPRTKMRWLYLIIALETITVLVLLYDLIYALHR